MTNAVKMATRDKESCKEIRKSIEWKTSFYMTFNFISATGIILLNKAFSRSMLKDLGGDGGIRFQMLFTALHFAATWLGLSICRVCGLYTPKKLNHVQVLPITLSFASFVICNNLSIHYNSLGFYQLMKVMTTPVVVFLQLVLFGVHLPVLLQLALLPVCAGVYLATTNDVDFNWLGCFWAVAGLLATAFYQLMIKTRIDALEASSFQLLHYQAPQALGAALLLAPACDDLPALLAAARGGARGMGMGAGTAALGLASAAAAFAVNLSTYLVIDATSPVSYQVLGHFKLIFILSVGIWSFGEEANNRKIAGIMVALFGIISYTTLKQNHGSGWEKKGRSDSLGGGKEKKS